MKFYNRYINGETEAVYKEIEELGQEAFTADNFSDIKKVLEETFKRVAYNLEVIHKELQEIGYHFKSEFVYNSEKPLARPLPNTDKLLTKLDVAMKPFGCVPESLKMFYRIVGACNFVWDYETNEDFIWVCADPIQIVSLDDLVSEVTDKEYLEDLQQYFEEDKFVALELSADYLHKDNISGGQAYALQLTDKRSIDSRLLFEEHNTTFINYLRISFDNCGFSRITNKEYKNDYQAFFDKVKHKLKKI